MKSILVQNHFVLAIVFLKSNKKRLAKRIWQALFFRLLLSLFQSVASAQCAIANAETITVV